MSALVATGIPAFYIRRFRGGSQPILVQATDGHFYVVKFLENPQGAGVLFNEAMGTELYRACGLPVPTWKPMLFTDEFIDGNPECWIEGVHGPSRPQWGLAFASRFLGEGALSYQLLTRSDIGRVQNTNDFWMAWLIDICANHQDCRQAVFVEKDRRALHGVFIDHGFMFGGPKERSSKFRFERSSFFEKRVYRRFSPQFRKLMERIVGRLDTEKLWRKASKLPIEWKTDFGLKNLGLCFDMLSNSRTVRDIIDSIFVPEFIADSPQEHHYHGYSIHQHERKAPNRILRTRIQPAGRVPAAP